MSPASNEAYNLALRICARTDVANCAVEIDALTAEKDAEIERLRKAAESLLTAILDMRKDERPIRMLGPTGANDAGRVLSFNVTAEAMSAVNDSAVALQDALAGKPGAA